jgi:hypothetical protein
LPSSEIKYLSIKILKLIVYFLIFFAGLCLGGGLALFRFNRNRFYLFSFCSVNVLVLAYNLFKEFKKGPLDRTKFAFLSGITIFLILIGFVFAAFKESNFDTAINGIIYASLVLILNLLNFWILKRQKKISTKGGI